MNMKNSYLNTVVKKLMQEAQFDSDIEDKQKSLKDEAKAAYREWKKTRSTAKVKVTKWDKFVKLMDKLHSRDSEIYEELALELAAAGVHALVEKPLAVDTPAAQKIYEAFRDKALVGAVGHIERYNPALQQLRARLDAGELGAVYQITTRRQGPFPARIADVGVVKDLATHDIDSTAWVARSPFVSVSAQTAHKSGRPHEDMVAVVGQLANGIITNHLVNWLTPFKERLTIVTGERGTFVADTLTADLTFYANASVNTEWDSVAAFRGVSEGDVIRYAFAKPEPLRVEHEAFRDAVLGLPGANERIVTMEQGLATVAVAGAILESAATKKVITL
jgi:predicted dehydrogenase